MIACKIKRQIPMKNHDTQKKRHTKEKEQFKKQKISFKRKTKES